MKKEKLLPILAPIFIITFGAIITGIFYSFMDEWVWVILALAYWSSSFTIAYKSLGKEAIQILFQKPIGSHGWLALSIFRDGSRRKSFYIFVTIGTKALGNRINSSGV